MNTATITDLAWEGAKVAFRLIMAARSRRDAEAIVHQLRALGETPRSDVAGIERERRMELAGFDLVDTDQLGTLRRLRQDEPTQSSPLEKRRHAPDFRGPLESDGFIAKPRCGSCGRQVAQCECAAGPT